MNGPNRHSLFLQLPNGNCFIDGLPDTCEHDYSDSVFQTASGKWIFWYTYRQWAGLPDKDRVREIYSLHQKNGNAIVLGTMQCKKCKKIYEPEIY